MHYARIIKVCGFGCSRCGVGWFFPQSMLGDKVYETTDGRTNGEGSDRKTSNSASLLRHMWMQKMGVCKSECFSFSEPTGDDTTNNQDLKR